MKVFLILVLVGLSQAYPQADGEPVRKNECQEDKDCQAYGYCHYSYWIGSQCLSNMKKQPHFRTQYCLNVGINDDTKTYPDHSVCQEKESKDNNDKDKKFTTSRCFEELGYLCAKSYSMPCTPNYDEEGNIIKGQEESCPENFTCEFQEYTKAVPKLRKVCKPVEVEYSNECKNDFDCGYSLLSSGWSRCFGGQCARVVE